MKTKILAFAGSLRTDSYNKLLVKNALRGAEAAGAETTYVDLKNFPMPIFDEDLEKANGLPEHAQAFKNLLIAHDGFLISSPEYNSSVSAALKNAIDWASRPADGEKPLVAFAGKIAGIMAASPGTLGGLRGLIPLRSILGNIQMIVIPDQIAIPKAFEAFDSEGILKDRRKLEQAQGIGSKVAKVASRLELAL